jgi:hypothetical protein
MLRMMIGGKWLGPHKETAPQVTGAAPFHIRPCEGTPAHQWGYGPNVGSWGMNSLRKSDRVPYSPGGRTRFDFGYNFARIGPAAARAPQQRAIASNGVCSN